MINNIVVNHQTNSVWIICSFYLDAYLHVGNLFEKKDLFETPSILDFLQWCYVIFSNIFFIRQSVHQKIYSNNKKLIVKYHIQYHNLGSIRIKNTRTCVSMKRKLPTQYVFRLYSDLIFIS